LGGAEYISYALEKPTYNKVMRCTARANAESPKPRAKPFFIVLARNCRGVEEKVAELERMGVPYAVVCSERVEHPRVVYREARGKWDAINFGNKFVFKGLG